MLVSLLSSISPLGSSALAFLFAIALSGLLVLSWPCFGLLFWLQVCYMPTFWLRGQLLPNLFVTLRLHCIQQLCSLGHHLRAILTHPTVQEYLNRRFAKKL